MPETRKLVLDAARELNYSAHPHAQSLRRKNSGEIVLVSENIDLGVMTRKLSLIQKGLSERGFNAPIYAYSHGDSDVKGANQDRLLASVTRVPPRAVACNVMTITERSREILLDLESRGTAVVCFDSDFDEGISEVGSGLDQVIFDRVDNTYQAAKHLLELGHRDLGLMIFGNSPSSTDRLSGFRRALEEYGIEPREEWIFRGHIPGSAAVPEFVGVKAAEYFAGLKRRPTGICVLNDLAALAFIGEIERAGLRVPQDMSVIGHDDIPLCEYAPLRLSSVSHPVDVIARTVVERITSRLEDETLRPQKQWIRGVVRARDSSVAVGSIAVN
jgi:DNA-binding LacI/PurR family transcriptional regulator